MERRMKRGNFKLKLRFDGIKILDDKLDSLDDVENEIKKLKVKFK